MHNFGARLYAQVSGFTSTTTTERAGLSGANFVRIFSDVCHGVHGAFYTMVVVCQPQSGVVQAELNCAPKRCALSATSTRRTE